MHLGLAFVFTTFLMTYSGFAQTAPKFFFKSISAQFDLIDSKTNTQIIRLSFDGRFGDKLLASIEKIPAKTSVSSTEIASTEITPSVSSTAVPLPTCDYSAEFKEVIIDKEKGLQFYLTSTCNENNQKVITKHGRILIKESNILSFKKSIYLSKTYPQIVLKTKDISY